MNKVILLFFLFISKVSLSQTNLQFSKVVYFKTSGNYQGNPNLSNVINQLNYKDTSISVPVGKVWKIESANVTSHGGSSGFELAPVNSGYSYGGNFLLLDNLLIASQTSANYTESKIDKYSNFPIWLPSGSYSLKLIGQSVAASVSYTVYASISALEFTLVP